MKGHIGNLDGIEVVNYETKKLDYLFMLAVSLVLLVMICIVIIILVASIVLIVGKL